MVSAIQISPWGLRRLSALRRTRPRLCQSCPRLPACFHSGPGTEPVQRTRSPCKCIGTRCPSRRVPANFSCFTYTPSWSKTWMRWFSQSGTHNCPVKSIATPCATSNLPGSVPLPPQDLRKFQFLSNFRNPRITLGRRRVPLDYEDLAVTPVSAAFARLLCVIARLRSIRRPVSWSPASEAPDLADSALQDVSADVRHPQVVILIDVQPVRSRKQSFIEGASESAVCVEFKKRDWSAGEDEHMTLGIKSRCRRSAGPNGQPFEAVANPLWDYPIQGFILDSIGTNNLSTGAHTGFADLFPKRCNCMNVRTIAPQQCFVRSNFDPTHCSICRPRACSLRRS
jgi:hypothetical protein